MPNRLAAIPKPIRESSHLWVVADQQTAIAFHVFLDRGRPLCRIFRTRDATIMCDDLMPAQHKRRRVISANIVAHEKQEFHLGCPTGHICSISRLSDCAAAGYRISGSTSAFGPLQTSPVALHMSAFGGKADMESST